MGAWEVVESAINTAGSGGITERMPVPGGWLYRCKFFGYGRSLESMVMVFVPKSSGFDEDPRPRKEYRPDPGLAGAQNDAFRRNRERVS